MGVLTLGLLYLTIFRQFAIPTSLLPLNSFLPPNISAEFISPIASAMATTNISTVSISPITSATTQSQSKISTLYNDYVGYLSTANNSDKLMKTIDSIVESTVKSTVESSVESTIGIEVIVSTADNNFTTNSKFNINNMKGTRNSDYFKDFINTSPTLLDQGEIRTISCDLYQNDSSLTPVQVTKPIASNAAIISRTEVIVSSVIFCCLSFVGIIGNMASIYVYNPRGKQNNLYAFYLSIIDFIMCLIIMPVTVINQLVSLPLILIYLFAVGLILIVLQSLEILVAISVDRFIACCRPQLYRRTQRYAKFVIMSQITMNCLVLGLAFVTRGTIIFTVICQIIILGSFVSMILLYTRIFITLRSRMKTTIPLEPTIVTAQLGNTGVRTDNASDTMADVDENNLPRQSKDYSVKQSNNLIAKHQSLVNETALTNAADEKAKDECITNTMHVLDNKKKLFNKEPQSTVQRTGQSIKKLTTRSVNQTSVSHNYQSGQPKHIVNAQARLAGTRTRNLIVTIKMFCAITVVFTLSYLPSYLISYNLVTRLPRTLAYSFYLNHVANPIIYFVINKTFRNKARKMFSTILPCFFEPPSELV